MRRNPLLFACLAVALSGCGGDDSSPSAPVDADPPPGPVADAGSADISDDDSPGGGQAADSGDPLTELVSGLRSPRDLVFGPAGSELDDELFVVHFEGVEATWVRAVDSGTPVLQRFENSLVGAIAVDIDATGRFYFACLTPVMGASAGVITVRTLDSQVLDFQYTGVDRPSGVALDTDGGLFVFNRGTRSVVRIDFADGASADRHSVQIVAENLLVTDDILPSHLLVDGDRLLITETGANRVLAWIDQELDVFADASIGLNQPVGIAALPSGNILVANYGDGMLVELDAEGTLQRTVDTGLGESRLLSVAVRSDGSVFIVDDDGGFGSLYRVALP